MDRETPRRQRFISMRVKILLGFTLLFSVVFAAAFWWFYNFATERAMNRIQQGLTDTLLAAAEGVDGDTLVALYEEAEANEEGFTDDPRYQELLDWLDTVHKIEPRAWPGTYIVEDDQVYFVTDLFERYDPDKAAGFKEWCDPNPELCGDASANINALSGEPQYELVPYDDQWGSWVSGFAPVHDSDGNVVAGIFVDFLADDVREVQNAIRQRVLGAFAVTYSVLFIVVYLMSDAITRPIRKLTTMAEGIGEGHYEQDFTELIKDRFPDEIETLAHVFKGMVAKVYQREQSLRKQVEQLQIIVDQSKRDQQVNEIVDSDFFQELQAKANLMRRRSKAEQSHSSDS